MEGEDEGDFCPTYAPMPPAKLCAADQFVCTDGSCIPGVFVCDGVWQCEDGEFTLNNKNTVNLQNLSKSIYQTVF